MKTSFVHSRNTSPLRLVSVVRGRAIDAETTRRLAELREAERALADAERALLLGGGRTSLAGERLQRDVDRARTRVSEVRSTWRRTPEAD